MSRGQAELLQLQQESLETERERVKELSLALRLETERVRRAMLAVDEEKTRSQRLEQALLDTQSAAKQQVNLMFAHVLCFC